MAKSEVKKGRPEAIRKFIVSLKKRPHNIPFVFMGVTFCVFSLNLTKISNTTAVVNKPMMGFSMFCVMLLSILSFITFLNAFPNRQKPKLPFVILLYLFQVICVLADVLYILRINEGLTEIKITSARMFIPQTKTLLTVHCALLAVSVVLIALIPVFKKTFAKIDTSVAVADSKMSSIELSKDE